MVRRLDLGIEPEPNPGQRDRGSSEDEMRRKNHASSDRVTVMQKQGASLGALVAAAMKDAWSASIALARKVDELEAELKSLRTEKEPEIGATVPFDPAKVYRCHGCAATSRGRNPMKFFGNSCPKTCEWVEVRW